MKNHILFLLALAILAAFAGSAVAGEPDWYTTATCTGGVVTDNTHTSGVRVPRGVHSVTVVTPTITSSTVGIEVSTDNSTYYTYKDVSNGTNIVATTSAAGTTAQAIQIPGNIGAWRYIRIVFGTAQAADRACAFYGTKLSK